MYHFRLGPATLVIWWAHLSARASSQTPRCRLSVHRVSLSCGAPHQATSTVVRTDQEPFPALCPPQSLESESGPPLCLTRDSRLCSVDLLFWVSSLIPLRSGDQFCMISILKRVKAGFTAQDEASLGESSVGWRGMRALSC